MSKEQFDNEKSQVPTMFLKKFFYTLQSAYSCMNIVFFVLLNLCVWFMAVKELICQN